MLPVARLPGDPGNYLGHFSAYSLAMVALAGVVRLRAWVTALALVFLGSVSSFYSPFRSREPLAGHAGKLNRCGYRLAYLVVWNGRQHEDG